MAAEMVHFLLFFGSQRLETVVITIHFSLKTEDNENNVEKDNTPYLMNLIHELKAEPVISYITRKKSTNHKLINNKMLYITSKGVLVK